MDGGPEDRPEHQPPPGGEDPPPAGDKGPDHPQRRGCRGHRPRELLYPRRRDPGRGGHRGLRPEGAVRGHRRSAACPVRPDDPQGGQHRGPVPQGHPGKGHLHVLHPRGPAGHGPGPLSVHHGQHDPEELRPGQGSLCGPEGGPGGRGARHQGAGGGHPLHRDAGAPPVRRQRAEGAAGPGDQGRTQRHRHRLSRAGAGHQLLLRHL